MKYANLYRYLRSVLLIAVALTAMSVSASAQRDYLTPEEIELIRDAQEIDRRVDVLIHAIDRRLQVLNASAAGKPISKKDSEKWGSPPEGTRFELLLDIKRILQKAIDDIDNLADRPESAVISPNRDPRENKGYAVLFPKAVKTLASAAERWKPVLKAEMGRATDSAEKGSILDSIDMCDQITAAVPKLPADAPKKKGT